MKNAALGVTLALFAGCIGFILGSLRGDPPAVHEHIADLPRGDDELWLTVEVREVREDSAIVTGCPAKNPAYGPVTFEIFNEEFHNAVKGNEGKFVPVLTVRRDDDWRYIGYATPDDGADTSWR